MINVVLVDDHELVRTGFRMILQQPDITVVGEAGSAEEGLQLIRKLEPEIALVDVHMPGMSGIELTERIVRAKLPTRVVIVTLVDDARFPKRLLDAGALGYLTKCCSAEELIGAVRQVNTGRRYLAAGVEDAQRVDAGPRQAAYGDWRTVEFESEDGFHLQAALDGEAACGPCVGSGALDDCAWAAGFTRASGGRLRLAPL